jgi:hypothetical protein
LGFNSWIDLVPLKQHGFLVLNFINLAILVGKNMEKGVNSRENVNNKKLAKNLRSKI